MRFDGVDRFNGTLHCSLGKIHLGRRFPNWIVLPVFFVAIIGMFY
jgi:hypothetical protein